MRSSATKTRRSSLRRPARIQTEHRVIDEAARQPSSQGSRPPGIIVSPGPSLSLLTIVPLSFLVLPATLTRIPRPSIRSRDEDAVTHAHVSYAFESPSSFIVLRSTESSPRSSRYLEKDIPRSLPSSTEKKEEDTAYVDYRNSPGLPLVLPARHDRLSLVRSPERFSPRVPTLRRISRYRETSVDIRPSLRSNTPR